jgi:signal transduction histidine kinase
VPTVADFATLPRNFAIVLAFNTAIALGLTFAGRSAFLPNLVYSQCIGISIMLIIDVTRRFVWGAGVPPRRAIIALSSIGIAGGFLLGSFAASAFFPAPGQADVFAPMAITLFAGVAGTWYFLNRERLTRLRLQAATVERGAVEARLKLLQAQIEPHFLFNTLANLHSLIATDPARAQTMLEHLNDYLRATLEAARRDSGTLGEEFALLRGYLEILAIRMGPRLAFTLSLPQELAGARLPPMLLQPLVENAVKHGLEPKIDGGRVDVSAVADGKDLIVKIEDTGLGLGNSAGKGTGVGVQHVRDRLAASYGSSAVFILERSPGGGTTATIRIPSAR